MFKAIKRHSRDGSFLPFNNMVLESWFAPLMEWSWNRVVSTLSGATVCLRELQYRAAHHLNGACILAAYWQKQNLDWHSIRKTIAIVSFSSLIGTCSAQIPMEAETASRLHTPSLPSWVTLIQDIRYDKYPDTTLDILRSRLASAGKHPGVIIIHGGGWGRGDKEERLEYAGMKWAEKGFVAAVVNYRLTPAAKAPAAVTDVLMAAQWFRDNAAAYGVDPHKIIVTGESAGAHLALMVAFTPPSSDLGPAGDIAAVISFSGITDVSELIAGPNARDFAKNWIPKQKMRLELARKVSPITYVRKGLPAVLTIHGDSDPVVPYSQSVKLSEALRKYGNQSELITVNSNIHGYSKKSLDDVFDAIFEFLRSRGLME